MHRLWDWLCMKKGRAGARPFDVFGLPPPHPEEPSRSEGVSKDGGPGARASWFETRAFSALLTMRSKDHFTSFVPVSFSRFLK
jgi:hypothetical protein